MIKIKGKKAKETYETRGQLPEFLAMSRRPGIGQAYFEKNKKEFEDEKKKIWISSKKGLVLINHIRYFDKLLAKENEEALKKQKEKRIKDSKNRMATIMSNTTLNIDEYRERKEIQNEKLNKNKRGAIK